MKLSQLVSRQLADKVPPGWVDRDTLARQEGLPHGEGNFFYVIKRAVESGILETRVFRIPRANGLRSVRHYKRVKQRR